MPPTSLQAAGSIRSLLALLWLYIIHVSWAKNLRSAGSPPLAPVTIGWQSGLMPVNASDNSQMFYWYFPPPSTSSSSSTDPSPNPAPIILWLQGGPGASGLVGLFYEMGAYSLVKDNEEDDDESATYHLADRLIGSWNDDFGMIFVDSPVGTGFSRTDTLGGYSRNEKEVATNLWTFLQGFYALYPEALDHDLYIMGESYGGHYVPAAAYHILTMNDEIAPEKDQPSTSSSNDGEGPILIPLEGIGIGDGLTVPFVQELVKARAAYDFGLIDGKTFLLAENFAISASLSALYGEYAEAREYRQQLEEVLSEASGVNLLDVREYGEPDLDKAISKWANDPKNKAKLHLPKNATWGTDKEVGEALKDDLMISFAPEVAAILDEYRLPVMLYQGQFDLKDGVASNEAWIRRLIWSGQMGYMNATRYRWFVDDDISKPAGYAQQYDLLTEVIISGAGHLVPMTQPQRALAMVRKWIYHQPFMPPPTPPAPPTSPPPTTSPIQPSQEIATTES